MNQEDYEEILRYCAKNDNASFKLFVMFSNDEYLRSFASVAFDSGYHKGYNEGGVDEKDTWKSECVCWYGIEREHESK